MFALRCSDRCSCWPAMSEISFKESWNDLTTVNLQRQRVVKNNHLTFYLGQLSRIRIVMRCLSRDIARLSKLFNKTFKPPKQSKRGTKGALVTIRAVRSLGTALVTIPSHLINVTHVGSSGHPFHHGAKKAGNLTAHHDAETRIHPRAKM